MKPEAINQHISSVAQSLTKQRIEEALQTAVTDPAADYPIVLQPTDKVALQFVQSFTPTSVGMNLEVLLAVDAVHDETSMVTLSDAHTSALAAEEKTGEKVPVEQMGEIMTYLSETPVGAPVARLLYTIFDEPEFDDQTVDGHYEHPRLIYAGDLEADGETVGEWGPIDNRSNPLGEPAYVFFMGLDPRYSFDDVPTEAVTDYYQNHDPGGLPEPSASADPVAAGVEIGDHFYNTKVDQYCWVVGFNDILGALLQYEDGEFYDNQLRADGLPAGPYERRPLPDDYSHVIPQPHNPCPPGSHEFVSDGLPTGPADVSGRICNRCGLSTITLGEHYPKEHHDEMRCECIGGCGTTGTFEEMVWEPPVEEIALCEGCYDPSLSAEEHIEKYHS